MHFSLLLGAPMLLFSSLAVATPLQESVGLVSRGASDSPFQLTPIFKAHLNLGKPSKQANVTGGVLIHEPIVNGTVYGPAINATVTGGLAYPQIIEQGTVQIPQIVVYGNTDDGVPFGISEIGIGSPKGQVTRIQLSIGGRYANLSTGYILASVNPNSEQTEVAVQGYLVTNVGSYF